jgi:predicted deacylase
MNDIVPKVDYIIDFHTGGDSRFNYSQIRIDAKDEETLTLAKNFGTKFILNSQHRDKSFREAATKLGKKVMLFEGGKAMQLDKQVTKAAIRGVIRTMHYLCMANHSATIAEYPVLEKQYLIKKSAWLRANYSGMYRREVSIGESIKKGQLIGSISDPYGDFERNVKAAHDGFIICSNQAPIVNQGDALVHVTSQHIEL